MIGSKIPIFSPPPPERTVGQISTPICSDLVYVALSKFEFGKLRLKLFPFVLPDREP
jgi:hypothetical protein